MSILLGNKLFVSSARRRVADRAVWNVLETVTRHGPINSADLVDLSGYTISHCSVAATILRRCGLMVPIHGKYEATERGKIALAIHRGKEKRGNYENGN